MLLFLSFLAGAAIVLLGWTWFFNTIFALYYAGKGLFYVSKRFKVADKTNMFRDIWRTVQRGIKGAFLG